MTQLTFALVVAVMLGTVPHAQRQPTGTTGTETAPHAARAQLSDSEGRSVGEAVFRQTPHGVLLKLTLTKVVPGVHGMHLHDVGRCDRPSFESAGDHFNPTNRQHGFLNPLGPHVGDLPNIDVPGSLTYSGEYFVAGVTLGPGPHSLMDPDGSSVVIHAARDDYATEPAGKAGDRLACGPIAR